MNDLPSDTPHRKKTRIDPGYLVERGFLQWNIIDSIANAVVGWFLICIYLFWQDPEATALSVTGVTFIVIGLVAFADIFGVFLYLTNKGIMMFMKAKYPPFPDIDKLKKICWGSNIFWFVLMFLASKASFDLTYQFMHSLYNG